MTSGGNPIAAGVSHPVKPSNDRLLFAVPLLLAAAVGLQALRERTDRAQQVPGRMLWFSSPAAVKRMALGYDNLVADIYWMRAVVYYGGQRLAAGASPNYDLLYQLLDLVTTLDPRFKIAYRFGAIFLAESYPNGPGRPDHSIELLLRGIDRTGHWEFMHDIGFVYYWWLQDYTKAAEWFQKASTVPGAPEFLKPLAATTLAKGGDRQSSRTLWQQVLEAGDAEWLRGNAEFRLKQLDAMDMLDQLNARARQFAATQGRVATDWRTLGPALGLRGIPLDPAGVPFAIDAATGTVRLAPESPLHPLPDESAPSSARPVP